MPPPTLPSINSSSSSADTHKTNPPLPRPSSLSLRAPRSASVQQLVSRWQAHPTPSSSVQPFTSAPAATSSSGSSHRALVATPVNAINGTLGPLDWTPKYGIPPDRARTSPLPLVTSHINPPSSSSPQATHSFLDTDRPSKKSDRSSRKPHLMPLRSVQPSLTIPSPVSPISDASNSFTVKSKPLLQSPSPSSPATYRTTSTPYSTIDTMASNTSLFKRGSIHSPTVLQSPQPDYTPRLDTHPHHEAHEPDRSAESSFPMALSTHSAVTLTQHPARQSDSVSQPRSNVHIPQRPLQHISQQPLHPAPPKPGLSKPQDGGYIFDLDAKVHLDSGKYLPSSFRRNMPEQVAPIPERSSSHLSAPYTNSVPTPKEEIWSNEDPSSIPLLPTCSLQKQHAKSSSIRAQATLWRNHLINEITRYASSPNVDNDDVLPVSADEVFKRDAAPIHLPALEEYLKNPVIFGEPVFTDSRLVCTLQEKELFQLDDNAIRFGDAQTITSSTHSAQLPSQSGSRLRKSKLGSSSSLGQLEIAGGQINCPALLYTSNVDSEGSSRTTGGLRRRRGAGGTNSRPIDKRKSSDADPLLSKGVGSSDKKSNDIDDVVDTETAGGGKERIGLSIDDDATLVAEDAVEAEKVASRISARLAESNNAGSRSATMSSHMSQPASEGVLSKFSTHSNPITRKEMFPPLMLLKNNNLDELKSNAIGPRKPPGGIWSIGWLGIIFDMVIGVEGSTFAAGILRLETLRDLFQIMTVQLHFQRFFDSSDPTSTSSKALKFLLQTLPAILGLDLVSVFGYAVIFFVVWIFISAIALWAFWRMTKAHNPNKTVEGFDSQGWIYKSSSRGTRFTNTCLVFGLGLLYLPLSKLALDALVWSSDFWPVPNPYKGGIDDPVPGALLGDPDIWRAPLEFCYTTTMRRDAFNWAYVIIPMAVLTIVFYTLWYPYKLMMTIKEMLPHVSPYNELGTKRSEEEMQIYYHRLLDRDKSPFNFLYNSYHRKWGYYKPLYILLFKLTNLIIICVLAKDNCLFRSFPTRTMLVVQQTTLIIVMTALLGLHLAIKPFVDKIGNRSEMVSRIGYVLTATIGLLVALNVQGSTVYNTTLLYIIQAFTYGGNIYFALIGMSFVAHQVKRWQNRVDYTIDLFSPVLDITKHIKRRVWEETLSILMLCGYEYHMPLDQVIAFSISDDDRWPPYLIDFQGSVAERHVENLKIVKQIGIEAYRSEAEFGRTEQGIYRQKLIRTIQRDFAGLDAYWRPQKPPFPSGVTSFFGKAFMVPFPPTLVLRYDEGGAQSITLTRIEEFEAYIEQNSDPKVVNKKMVRQALRALEGQKVFCPHVENVQVGDATSGMAFVDRLFGRISRRGAVPRFGVLSAASGGQSEYVMATPISYLEGTLKIERRNEFDWPGYNFDSGFDVCIVYDEGRMKESNGALSTIRKKTQVSASRAFGLTQDFEMNAALSRFLQDNESVVVDRAPKVEKLLGKYRGHYEREARWKERVLPYSFLSDVFDNDGLSPLGLRMALVETGCARTMRNLPILYEGCITLMYERLAAINRSPVHRFWWILFDELWRLNSNDYTLLRKYRRSFSPQYPTSIAYRPMTRHDLESFLTKRGLWKNNGAKGGPFNRGLLNKIYFYLNEIVFAGHHTGRASAPTIGRDWSVPLHPHDQPPPPQQQKDSGVGEKRGCTSNPPSAENPFLDPVDSDLRRAATIKVGLGRDATHATQHDFSTLDKTSGSHARELETDDENKGTNSLTPSHYTGGGTAYSNDSVVVRTAYRWEQRLDGSPTNTLWQRTKMRFVQWMSLQPVEVKFDREKLYLYLKLETVQDKTGKQVNRWRLIQPSPSPSRIRTDEWTNRTSS